VAIGEGTTVGTEALPGAEDLRGVAGPVDFRQPGVKIIDKNVLTSYGPWTKLAIWSSKTLGCQGHAMLSVPYLMEWPGRLWSFKTVVVSGRFECCNNGSGRAELGLGARFRK